MNTQTDSCIDLESQSHKDFSSCKPTSLNYIPSLDDLTVGGSTACHLKTNPNVDSTISIPPRDLEEGGDKDLCNVSNEESIFEHETNEISIPHHEPPSVRIPHTADNSTGLIALRPVQMVSEDTESDNTQEIANPMERVDEMAENKMENLKCFLILNTFGHFFGFLTQINLVSYFAVFLLILLVVLVMLAKSTREKEDPVLASYEGRSKFFRIANWTFMALYLFMVLLKCCGKIETLSPWTIPGCLSVFLESFFMSSTLTSGERGLEISLKYAIWVQLFLIAVKVDGATIPWAFTLFVFIAFGFVSLMVSIILFIILVSTIMGVPCYSATGKVAIMGSAWYFLISLSNVLWGAITIHVTNQLAESKEHLFLQGFFLIGTLFSLGLVIFTKNYFHILSIFLKYEALNDLQEMGEFENQINKLITTEKAPRYKYLSKITATYFSTLQKSFQLKNKEVLSKLNKEIKRTKVYELFCPKTGKMYPKSTNASPVKIVPKRMKRSASFELVIQDSLVMIPQPSENAESNPIEQDKAFPSDESKNQRTVFPLEEKTAIGNGEKLENEGNVDDKDMCFVCYEVEADAVIMDCGHGGICHNCAIKGWERSDKCHMCRRDIKSVMRVKTFKGINIVKVIDETQKVLSRDDIIA